jgi:hypothetical protein
MNDELISTHNVVLVNIVHYQTNTQILTNARLTFVSNVNSMMKNCQWIKKLNVDWTECKPSNNNNYPSFRSAAVSSSVTQNNNRYQSQLTHSPQFYGTIRSQMRLFAGLGFKAKLYKERYKFLITVCNIKLQSEITIGLLQV